MAPDPFDLNRALLDWRSQLAAASPCRDEDLDEMESHLRDSVTALESRGLATDEAFLIATRRMGSGRGLAEELAKVHPGEAFRFRAAWMLVGMLLLGFATDLARVASGSAVLGGNRLHAGAAWLGWLGLAAGALILVAGAVLFARFASGGWSAPSRPGWNRLRRAAFLAPVLIGGLLAAKLAALTGPVALARELGPAALGGVFLLQGWGQTVGGFLFVIVGGLFLVALVARGAPTRGAVTALLLTAAGLVMPGMSVRLEAAAAVPPASFDEVLGLWRAGKKDDALQRFAVVDFTRRPLFPKGSVLGYSEKEFVALPRAVNEKLHGQILEEVRPMKGLALYVKEGAAAAAQRGDKTRADLYLGQLKKCGAALEHPDSLALLQAVGKAFGRLASEAPAGPPASKPH
jgi:hypothetical protein